MNEPLTRSQWLWTALLIFWLSLLLVFAFGMPWYFAVNGWIGFLIHSATTYRQKASRSSASPASNLVPATYQPPTQADLQGLHKQLNSLTHDRALSQRLIEQTMTNYPERSLEWVIEKVIEDLRRDRR